MPWIQAICAATDGPDKPAMTAGERSALAVNVLIIHVISEMCVRPSVLNQKFVISELRSLHLV